MGLLRAAVPGSPLLMLQYSFSLHIVVSDGELKAGGSYPHRMFGSPVASARCEVHNHAARPVEPTSSSMSGTGPVICERIVQDWGQLTHGRPFGRMTFDSTVDSLRASR